MVPVAGQGEGLQGVRGARVGLQDLRGSRGRPTGSQGVKAKGDVRVVPQGLGGRLRGPLG